MATNTATVTERRTSTDPDKGVTAVERCHELFLQAVGAALKSEKVTWDGGISREDWEDLFRLALAHHMLPLFFEAVFSCPAIATADPERIRSVRQTTCVSVMQQAVRTMEFLQLYRNWLDAGVEPLVVKGIICRRLYPNPDHRKSGDEDVLIRPADYDRVRRVMTSFDMETADGHAEKRNAFEVPFQKKNSPLYIELHKSLFASDSAVCGEFNGFFTHVHDRPEIVEVDGVPIRTMAPTENMFYLILHAFKHFLYSGFGVRQVCDMMLYAGENGNRICRKQVLENCRAVRAEKFAAALFQIGAERFGFDPEETGYARAWSGVEVDHQALLEELVSAGIYGQANMSRKHSSNITLDAVAAQKQGKKAKNGLIVSVFPPARALEGRYPYLHKNPWLLPVAWVSRIVQYGGRSRSEDTSNAAEILKMGSQRVALLKQYEIID